MVHDMSRGEIAGEEIEMILEVRCEEMKFAASLCKQARTLPVAGLVI